MPVGPPAPGYWDDFPAIDKEEERLAAYRVHRARDANPIEVWDSSVDERRRVAEVIFALDLHKRGAGPPLTQAQQNILAYSPYGTASRCGY